MAKYRIPDDVKYAAIAYVQGYERRKKIYAKIQAMDTSAKLSMERSVVDHDMFLMRAVEAAADMIGERYESDEIRRKLQAAVMENCASGGRLTYEKISIPTISRKDFYLERRKFLWNIARLTGLILDARSIK